MELKVAQKVDHANIREPLDRGAQCEESQQRCQPRVFESPGDERGCKKQQYRNTKSLDELYRPGGMEVSLRCRTVTYQRNVDPGLRKDFQEPYNQRGDSECSGGRRERRAGPCAPCASVRGSTYSGRGQRRPVPY